MKRCIQLLATLLVTLLLASSALAEKEVRLAYVEWDCAAASTNLVKAVLEERMGYEVEILPVTGAAMWMAVGSGDVDGMVTAWLPVTHADYLKQVEGTVEDLGPIVGGAKLGWAVPAYVDIDSIEQLPAHAEKFDNKVIGIDPGAGLMRLSEEAMSAYGLDDFELMEGSGSTMTAALGDAIKNDEWVVVTAWSPHWMFGRWELKYLEDPKGVLGEEEKIHTIVRTDLEQDMPDVYAFLDKFSYENPDQLQALMAWNQEEGADRYENAKRFMKEYPELVDSWLQ